MGLFGLTLHLISYLVPVVEDIFGLVYPILATAKAIVQEDSEAASQWLTYWTVYSVFVIFEGTSEWLISWMPFYNECKLLFVCWLVLPRFEGAVKIYERLVIPYFLEYEEQIDERLSEASVEAKRHLSTFIMYLVTEGSKMAGEKSMAGVSLFLRLTGFSSVLGDQNQVDESTVYAVATVVGDAIQATVVEDVNERSNTTEKHITVIKKSVKDESKSMEIEGLSVDVYTTVGEGKESNKYDINETLDDSDDNEMNDERDKEEELQRAEEGKELLDDFLAVIEDGIYLNVSTADPDSSPRLRIVTLSRDRWRLLWSNLRQRGAASSLHLCTVSSIDSRPLCVSLVSSLPPKIVSFEAQGEEVHDVLSEGLRLLISDARLRSQQVLVPIAKALDLRLLRDAFRMLTQRDSSTITTKDNTATNITLRRSNRHKSKTVEL